MQLASSPVTIAAVLFDWRGTLVTSPGPSWAIERSLTALGRPAPPNVVESCLAALLAANGDDNRLDSPGMDTDAAVHYEISMAVLRDAGFDEPFAEALYAIDADPAYNRFAADVHPTMWLFANEASRSASSATSTSTSGRTSTQLAALGWLTPSRCPTSKACRNRIHACSNTRCRL